jgi:hypothetical protein
MKSVDALMPPELDYWVAKAEGIFFMRGVDGQTYQIDPEGVVYVSSHPDRCYRFAACSDWRLAGPIIHKHRISPAGVGRRVDRRLRPAALCDRQPSVDRSDARPRGAGVRHVGH